MYIVAKVAPKQRVTSQQKPTYQAEPTAVRTEYFQLPCATKCVKVVTLSE